MPIGRRPDSAVFLDDVTVSRDHALIVRRGGDWHLDDLGSLSDQELKDLIQQLTEEEVEVSYRRRILHGKIDILRAELVNRLRKKHETGEDVISGADVQRLTDILAGRNTQE